MLLGAGAWASSLGAHPEPAVLCRENSATARAAAGARQGRQYGSTGVLPCWRTQGAPVTLAHCGCCFNAWFLHLPGIQPQGDETSHCLTHMRSPLPLCQATVIPFRQCPLASFRIQVPTELVLLWLLIDDARPWEGLTSLREAGALVLPCESRSIFCSSWTVFKVPRKEGEDLWGGSCPPCSDAGSSCRVCLTLTVPCAVILLEKAWKNSGKFLWKNGKLWKIPTTSYCRDSALR